MTVEVEVYGPQALRLLEVLRRAQGPLDSWQLSQQMGLSVKQTCYWLVYLRHKLGPALRVQVKPHLSSHSHTYELVAEVPPSA